MSKVLSLVKAINHDTALTSHEKVVGITLVLSYIWSQNRARMRKDTLMQRTGLSQRTIERAIKGLCDKGIFVRKITGRATIFTIPGSILSSVLVGSPHMATLNDTYGESPIGLTADEWHNRKVDEDAAEYLKGLK